MIRGKVYFFGGVLAGIAVGWFLAGFVRCN